ncbi:MAG TPA: hypothetical protein VGG64_22205 [Pirellulales bacterium]|jgi:hypothetical protein
MYLPASRTRLLLAAAVITLAGAIDGTATSASDGLLAPRPRYDLFYNYYAGPSVNGGQPAQLYVSPRPTPPFVGHTYITYQPLLPHEFMYKHCRVYARYNVTDCGATKTKVCWW